MRGIPASLLLSEFCTVQVLEGQKTVCCTDTEVLTFGSILKYHINGASTGIASSGRISEVAANKNVSVKGDSTLFQV